eukprot:TRINITY_DN13523_c0_g1_i2.p1 TRINITY_DN13523_c0_g1~~TRINITY_DN13523_c0_g1_i2.p1  ORF type:complete len:290 (+),score=61.74 TRINITY_DN13523_c0_g1_i2:688-1557(+)
MTGDTNSGYVETFARAFLKPREEEEQKKKFKLVVLNHRGSPGDVPMLNCQFYSGAYTGDLKQGLDHIRECNPKSKMVAIAFSLGANLLVKYLGDVGYFRRRGHDAIVQEMYKCNLDAAIAIGSPHDILQCSRRGHRTMYSRCLYAKSMSDRCKKLFSQSKERCDLFKGNPFNIDLDKALKARTLREFDDEFFRKMFGFRTVDEFFRESVSASQIPDIEISTLMVNAQDDPICSREAHPIEECLISENCVLITTRKGAHGLEWFQGAFGHHSWVCKTASLFLDQVLSQVK